MAEIAQSELNITLPSTITTASFESAVEEAYLNYKSIPKNVTLDFSNCDFIEIPSLLQTIVFFASRERAGFSTSMRLPKNKPVRDILRAWEFPVALKKATGVTFFNSVALDDRDYFGENKNSQELKYVSWSKGDAAVERLYSTKFFSLITIPIENGSNVKLAETESDKWKTTLILSTFKKYLDLKDSASGIEFSEKQIGSRIIFEAITNAQRHPNASLIQTCSVLQLPQNENGTPNKGAFTISFWDNGESMIDTLNNAISANLKVKIDKSIPFTTNYLLKFADKEKGTEHTKAYSSDTCPDKEAKEEVIFLSTIIPGITRDIVGDKNALHPDTIGQAQDFAHPGMGLALILNTAIDILGGSVSIRTKHYFMNVKACSSSNKNFSQVSDYTYKVKIIRFKKRSPEVIGNMLTIRIPIRK